MTEEKDKKKEDDKLKEEEKKEIEEKIKKLREADPFIYD